MDCYKSIVIPMVLLCLWFFRASEALSQGYYQKTCPNAEWTVKKHVFDAVQNDPGAAAGLLRMHFHDCFVNGCDGSVLIDSTPDFEAEKDAPPNNPSLRGFEIVDQIKEDLEGQCPGIVSCADILAFAARDSIEKAGGGFWYGYEVEGGRLDSRFSRASDAIANLPSPASTLDQLKANFSNKGLSPEEMVILSGAHTIGVSHCSSFVSRLYNFSKTQKLDPALNRPYAYYLETKCPPPGGLNTTTVSMDPQTPNTFDNKYYQGVLNGIGLFSSDHALMTSTQTGNLVLRYAGDQNTWLSDFKSAMVNMGRIDVITKTSSKRTGEIRRNCRRVN